MRGEFLLKAGKPVLTEKQKQSLQSRDGSRGFAPSPLHASQAKPRKKEDKRREAAWMGFPRPLPLLQRRCAEANAPRLVFGALVSGGEAGCTWQPAGAVRGTELHRGP